MLLYAKGTFTGKYRVVKDQPRSQARYVIGHEYGAPQIGQFGLVNEAIARYIVEHYPDMPVCASKSVASALEKLHPKVKLIGVFSNTSADTTASTGGTWEELRLAKKFSGSDWQYPVLVAQAFHIGRVSQQARKLGMQPTVPPELPRIFDPTSSQWWCHNAFAWAAREIPGAMVLRLRAEL